MSRNLARTDCKYCGWFPELDEKPRPITKDDAFVYYDDYKGMMVANATCPACEAKYLAWVSNIPYRLHFEPSEDMPFADLCFRSTFNDEPGNDDLPVWEVETTWKRVGKWKG